MRVVGVQMGDPTSACATCGAGTGPRTRRRWPRRAVRLVEQDGGPAVLPPAGAVAPPCQGARHGAPCPPTCPDLIRRWVRSRPTGSRWASADPSTWALARGRPNRGTRVTVWSPFCSRKSSSFIIGPLHRFWCQAPQGAGCQVVGVICRSGRPRCMRSECGAPSLRCRCGERASLSRRRLGQWCSSGVRTSASAASDRPAPG